MPEDSSMNHQQRSVLKKSGRRVQLPPHFTPGPLSVLCGRGSESTSKSPGNQLLMQLIETYKQPYSATAKNNTERDAIISTIVNIVKQASPGGAFIEFEDGCWWEMEDSFAGEKIGCIFQETLHTKYRSSAQAKKLPSRNVSFRKPFESNMSNHSQSSPHHDGHSSLINSNHSIGFPSVATVPQDQPSKKPCSKPVSTHTSVSDDVLIPQRFTKKGRRRAIPFPVILMQLLSNREYTDIITWMPDGKSFDIIRPKAFVSEVLPKYFKSTKYPSFTRNLNRWGFERVDAPGAREFYHKSFLKGRVDLAERMVRPYIVRLSSQKKSKDLISPKANVTLTQGLPSRSHITTSSYCKNNSLRGYSASAKYVTTVNGQSPPPRQDIPMNCMTTPFFSNNTSALLQETYNFVSPAPHNFANFDTSTINGQSRPPCHDFPVHCMTTSSFNNNNESKESTSPLSQEASTLASNDRNNLEDDLDGVSLI